MKYKYGGIPQKYSFYIVGAIMVLTPLVYIPGKADPGINTFLKWLVFAVLSVASFSLWAGKMKLPDIRRADLPELSVFFLLATSFISFVFSFERGTSSEHILRLVLLWIFSVTVSRIRISNLERILNGLMIIALVLSFLGIFLAAGIDPLLLGPESLRGIALTFPSGSTLGAFLLFPLAVTLNATVSKENQGERVLYAVFSVTILTCIFLTKSRSAWMGTGAVLIVSILFHLMKSRKVNLRNCLISVFLVLLISVIAVFGTIKSLDNVSAVTENRIVAERMMHFENALLLASEKPVTGWGPGVYGLSSSKYKGQLINKPAYKSADSGAGHAYNDPMEILADQGMLGLTGYILVLGSIFIFSFKGSDRFFFSKIASGMAGLVVFSLFHFTVSLPLPSVYLWFSIGAIISGRKKTIFDFSGSFTLKRTLIPLFLVIMLALWITPMVRSTYYFHSGSYFLTEEDYLAASSCFAKAADIKPWFFQAHNNLGIIYMRERNFTAAIKEFNRALEIAPYEDRIHFSIGYCFANLRRFDEAALSFEASLQYNPRNRRAYFMLRDIYSRTGEKDKLLVLADKAAKQNINITIIEEKK